MLLWGSPETNALARQVLQDMEEAVQVKLLMKGQNLREEALKWAPMPC